MKLCNFLSFDPDYHGKSLEAGSKLDEEAWNKFYPDRERLSDIATAICQNYKYLTPPKSNSEEAKPSVALHTSGKNSIAPVAVSAKSNSMGCDKLISIATSILEVRKVFMTITLQAVKEL